MTETDALRVTLVILGLSGATLAGSPDVPCEGQILCPVNSATPERNLYCTTSSFWFEAETLSGASGDVVGVTISLHYAPEFDFVIGSIELAVCHDPVVVELVGEPVYSEDLLERDPFFLQFLPVDENEDPENHRGHSRHGG